MSKRGADKYLTDQNWDQDDDAEEEEHGIFKKADDDVLKTRVIRKAKRRVVGGQSSSGSAFAGFSGLGTPATNKPTGVFQGFNLPGNKNNAVSKGFAGFSPSGSSASTQFKLQSSNVAKAMNTSVTTISTVMKESKNLGSTQTLTKNPILTIKSSDEDEGSHNSKEYNRHLSALNRSVSEWIKNHVEKNPLCDLTPIFRDYKKHLAEVDEKFGHSDQENSQNSFTISDSQQTVSPKSSQDSSRASTTSDNSRFALSGFGTKMEEKKEPESSEPIHSSSEQTDKSSKIFTGFQVTQGSSSPFKGFNIPNKPLNALPGFAFSSTMASGVSQPTETNSGQSQTNQEEYEPPKPESTSHVEEDAFFSIRCKLYYKKDESFKDRGVGQLYLKSVNEKTQLLVRADTAISQILLNIFLDPSVPMLKQGKNNIMITCIPNPPIDEKEKDKVTPMLIRVKTSDEADELLKIMEEKKNESPAKGDADR